MKTHKTIFHNEFQLSVGDKEFNYQNNLTTKLDLNTSLFDQEIINEIVLWKVNRYALVNTKTLKLINEIDSDSTILDSAKTKIVLKNLIQTKGIQLPMASTILRFKNKHIYQIIDQRVYRIIYENKKLKLNLHLSDKNLNAQINLYLQYLKDLKIVCNKLSIPFEESDRILFMADKRFNKGISLDNYSTKVNE